MLVRSYRQRYSEDIGLLTSDNKIFFHENGWVKKSSCGSLHPILHVHVLWAKKDVRAKCYPADTPQKKREGLQGYNSLNENEGMYFPYINSDVTFHQGTVPFSLDILFLRNSEVIDMVENTVVGSTDKWSCAGCDGVLEFNAGFIEENKVETQDKLAFFSITKRDLLEFEKERSFLAMIAEEMAQDGL